MTRQPLWGEKKDVSTQTSEGGEKAKKKVNPRGKNFSEEKRSVVGCRAMERGGYSFLPTESLGGEECMLGPVGGRPNCFKTSPRVPRGGSPTGGKHIGGVWSMAARHVSDRGGENVVWGKGST